MDCNICLTEGISSDKIKFLDCKHYICKSCFEKLVRNMCPYCRAIIPDKEDGHYPTVNYSLDQFYQEDIYNNNFLSSYSLNYDFDYLYNYYITRRSIRLRNRNNRIRRNAIRDKEIIIESNKKKRKKKKKNKKIEKTIFYGSDNDEIITMTYSNYLNWMKDYKKKFKHKKNKRRNTS